MAERDLDDVMMRLAQNERTSFLRGPLRRTLDGGETVIDEDAFLVTAAGRRLNIAYRWCRRS